MNFPNALTAARVVLAFASAFALCVNVEYSALAAFVLFLIGGATDWFDGRIARQFNMVTTFGKFMDALADKIMVIGMFMALFAFGLFKDWTLPALVCALLSVAREFFVSGIRMLAANKSIVLAAETVGKYKAALQMYSVGALLFANACDKDFLMTADSQLYMLAFYTGIAALGVSTILSVWSGTSYGIKYGYLLKAN